MAIKNRKPKKIYPVNVASLLQWDYIIGIPKCLKKLGWMILAKSRGMTDKIESYINSISRLLITHVKKILCNACKKRNLRKKNYSIILF